MIWRVVVTFVFFKQAVFGAPPPEASAIIDALPDKRLSLNAVLSQAIRLSDSYQGLKAIQMAADSMELSSHAPTDARVFAKSGYSDDGTEGASPISPIQSRGLRYSAGIEKHLQTGTTLSMEATHSIANSRNASIIGDLNYAESKITVGIQQSLWKNALGTADRARFEANQRAAQANRLFFDVSREDWALQLGDLFYNAWLSQQKLLLANESLARRKRLLDVVEIRNLRGTAERSDLLQVRSALARAKIGRDHAQHELNDRWHLLVTTLKLPVSLSTIDPTEIPIASDFDIEGTLSRCGPPQAPREAPDDSSETKRSELQKLAAKAALDAARGNDLPDLDLIVNAATNSVDPSSEGTLNDLSALKYSAYSASVVLSLPLGSFASKAQVQALSADSLKAGSQWSQAKDLLKTTWRSRCLELHRLRGARAELSQAVEWQTERERHEETRFSLGRTTTSQVIQAGDDRAETAAQLRSVEAALYLTALTINKMSGQLLALLKSLSG